MAGDLEPRLLVELAECRGERFFSRLDLPFGDGPSPLIALRPVGSARVHQQDLQPRGIPPIEEQAGTDSRHCRLRFSDLLGNQSNQDTGVKVTFCVGRVASSP
jgi:hypothetical protein